MSEGPVFPHESRLSSLHVLSLVVTVVASRLLAVYSFPIYDDAFITFRYSQNLADGLGLVFNPGASWEPVLGTTTPGYAVLLAGFHALGLDLVDAARGVNLVCDVVIALLLAHLLDRRAVPTLVALIAFAAMPEISRISVGGMEPPVLVALGLGGLAAARAGRLVLGGTLIALACTIRPEAVLLVPAVGVFHVRSVRAGLRFLAPVAVIGIACAGTLWWVYGHPIPLSVRAKAGPHGLRPRTWRVAAIVEQAFAPSYTAVFFLPFAAIGYVRGLLYERGLRPWILFGLGVVAAYLTAGVKTWGWYYYVPLVAWAVALGLGIEVVYHRIHQSEETLSEAPHRGQVPIFAALVAVLVVAGYTRVWPDEVTPQVYSPLEAWCKAERLAERDVAIAASDIGAIGFFSGARILDSEGLVWPGAKEFDGQVDIVSRLRPEYVFLVANRERVEAFLETEAAAHYRPVRRFNKVEDYELEPVAELLPRGWVQDYLVYERVEEP